MNGTGRSSSCSTCGPSEELRNLAAQPEQQSRRRAMHAAMVAEMGEDPEKTEARWRAGATPEFPQGKLRWPVEPEIAAGLADGGGRGIAVGDTRGGACAGSATVDLRGAGRRSPAPADGAVATSNPPSLLWASVKHWEGRDVRYVVSLSYHPAFPRSAPGVLRRSGRVSSIRTRS